MYERVLSLLQDHPQTRNSDKKLFWRYCVTYHGMDSDHMTLQFWTNGPSYESITRARRKVQEIHPELTGVDSVQANRKALEQMKGNFIFSPLN